MSSIPTPGFPDVLPEDPEPPDQQRATPFVLDAVQIPLADVARRVEGAPLLVGELRDDEKAVRLGRLDPVAPKVWLYVRRPGRHEEQVVVGPVARLKFDYDRLATVRQYRRHLRKTVVAWLWLHDLGAVAQRRDGYHGSSAVAGAGAWGAGSCPGDSALGAGGGAAGVPPLFPLHPSSFAWVFSCPPPASCPSLSIVGLGLGTPPVPPRRALS